MNLIAALLDRNSTLRELELTLPRQGGFYLRPLLPPLVEGNNTTLKTLELNADRDDIALDADAVESLVEVLQTSKITYYWYLLASVLVVDWLRTGVRPAALESLDFVLRVYNTGTFKTWLADPLFATCLSSSCSIPGVKSCLKMRQQHHHDGHNLMTECLSTMKILFPTAVFSALVLVVTGQSELCARVIPIENTDGSPNVFSMADATTYPFPCSSDFDDNPSQLLQFRGTGGPVRLSTCTPETIVDTVLVVEERSRASCEDTVYCSATAAPEDVGCDVSTASVQSVEFHTELDADYYVAVQQAPSAVAATDPVIGLSYLAFERPGNDLCETAELLTPSTTTGPTVVGSTANASLTDFPCGGDRDDSPAVFYSIRGTGAKWKFTTCTEQTDFSTSLALEEDFATCDDNPFCSPNDFVVDATCDGAQELEVFSVQDQAYLLTVQGMGSSDKGTFGLEFLEYVRPENDECETATLLEPSNSLAPVQVASTANATLYNFACSSDGDDVPVVFYELRGTGARWRISTCATETEFETVLKLSEDFETCEDNPFCSHTAFAPDFECNDNGFGQTHWLYSIENKKYMLAVSGLATSDKGVFGLSFLEYIRPENDQCETATVLTPSNHANSVAVGSTANATLFDFACSSDYDDTPVVFYEVRGTGLRWRISTCTEETEFETAIQMIDDFSNCENENFCSTELFEQDFDCDDTGMGVSKEFFSVKNQAYMLALSGRASTDMGMYGLQFIEYIPPNNDACDAAEMLSLPNALGEVLLTQGSTANATIAETACGTRAESPNAFYRFRGTGDRVRISTCSDITDFDTSVFVESGFDSCDGCSFDVENGYLETDFNCDDTGKAVSGEIMTAPDRMYSIVIAGRSISEMGSFGLAIEILPADGETGGTSQSPPTPIAGPAPSSSPDDSLDAPDSGSFRALPDMILLVCVGVLAYSY